MRYALAKVGSWSRVISFTCAAWEAIFLIGLGKLCAQEAPSEDIKTILERIHHRLEAIESRLNEAQHPALPQKAPISFGGDLKKQAEEQKRGDGGPPIPSPQNLGPPTTLPSSSTETKPAADLIKEPPTRKTLPELGSATSAIDVLTGVRQRIDKRREKRDELVGIFKAQVQDEIRTLETKMTESKDTKEKKKLSDQINELQTEARSLELISPNKKPDSSS